jgi:hypothetical protein
MVSVSVSDLLSGAFREVLSRTQIGDFVSTGGPLPWPGIHPRRGA